MKNFVTLVLIVVASIVLVPSNKALGQTRYVNDDVSVFMHSGPGRQFRIIGNVVAGVPIKILDGTEQNGFIQIETNEGREGWIEVQYTQRNKSFRTLLPETQEKLVRSLERVSQLEATIDELNNSLSSLRQEATEKSKLLNSANANISELEAEVETRELDIQVRWLINGGGLAISSIILGILITYLPKKRKRNDGWAD